MASLLSQRHSWADLLLQSSKVDVSAEPSAALWELLACDVGFGLGLEYAYGALEVVGGGLGEGTSGQDGGSEEVTHYGNVLVRIGKLWIEQWVVSE